MRELGWAVVNGSKLSPSVRIPQGAFHFPIPVPFGIEKTA